MGTETNLLTIGNMSLQRPSIIAAWVDQSIGDAGSHRNTKALFETLSTSISQWLYFDSSDQFTSYIEKNPHIKLIAIMSGGMSRLLVPQHSHCPNLHSLYVFCVDVERARESLKDEKKIKGVFNVEEELYDQLADDVSQILVEEGIADARLDNRTVARLKYEEAKRILNTQVKKIHVEVKRTRIQEIDDLLDQLLA